MESSYQADSFLLKWSATYVEALGLNRIPVQLVRSLSLALVRIRVRQVCAVVSVRHRACVAHAHVFVRDGQVGGGGVIANVRPSAKMLVASG